MTDSIKDRAREAQAARLGDDEALIEATQALYDSVDSLTTDQKTLLVREALHKVSGLIDLMGRAPSAGALAGYAAVGHAITALAGYAIEEFREGEGFTSTGDVKVTKAIDGVKHLLGLYAESQMTPEQRALSQKIKDAVDARVEAGEEFDAAMSDELRKHGREVAEVEAPAASTGKVARPDDGMYL